MIRRLLEHYYVWLKEDLQVAIICDKTKKSLLTHLRDNSIFMDDITAYFRGDVPFKILHTDPSQVSALKKILNALDHAQEAFNDLETMDLREGYYTASVGSAATKAAYKAIHELYTCIQLINESTNDVQRIIGPQLNALLPKLTLASQGLQQFAPANPQARAESAVLSAFQMLPTQGPAEGDGMRNLGSLVMQLPDYFESLQKVIATRDPSAFFKAKPQDSQKQYQKMMQDRVSEAQDDFEGLSQGNPVGMLFFSYASTAKLLLQHSNDLLNKSAPLTKEAYASSLILLDKIRHEILPNLVAEAESMEESMGLAPGVLTAPLITKMETYYQKLANQVNYIASAAGLIDYVGDLVDESWGAWIVRGLLGADKPLVLGSKITPDLSITTMQDETFVTQLRVKRVARLAAAQLESGDIAELQEAAAKRFFDKIASYGVFYQATCKWSLANLSPQDKTDLMNDYKLFQPHFAALHSDVDRLIVGSLLKTNDGGLLQKLWHTDYSQAMGITSNSFKHIMGCKTVVMNHIEQAQAQAEFKVKLIEKSTAKRELALRPALDAVTQLKEDVPAFEAIHFVMEAAKSSAHYQQKRVTNNIQLIGVNAAQAKFKEFFKILATYTSNPEIKNLIPQEKEALRKLYQHFQAHVALVDSGLNTRLICALSDNPSDGSLKVEDLNFYKRTLETHFEETVVACEQDELLYADQEMAAKVKELRQPVLAPLGGKTLLTQLNGLQLSKKISDFTNDKLLAFMKLNMDPAVLEQLAYNEQDLPYLNFHKDSPTVEMYKNLLNSLYYLKTGLAQLEQIKGDPSSLAYRTHFVVSFLKPVLVDFLNAHYYLSAASQNPGLSAVMSEGLKIIAPLQDIPVVGSYLQQAMNQVRPSNTPAPAFNALEAWNKQLAVVKKGISSGSKRIAPPKVDVAEVVVDVVELPVNGMKYYLEQIAEQLYQLPVKVQRLSGVAEQDLTPDYELQEQIGDLIETLSVLIDSPGSVSTYSPDSIKSILLALNDVNTQLSTLGMDSRALIIKSVGEMRSLVGADLIALADKTEFNLGLKAGTLSAKVAEQLDQVHASLMNKLSFKGQDMLALRISTASTERRLQIEKDRLAAVLATNEAQKTEAIIFGKPIPQYNELLSLFARLDAIVEENDAEDNDDEEIDNILHLDGEFELPDHDDIQPVDPLRAYLSAVPRQENPELPSLLPIKKDLQHIYNRLLPYLSANGNEEEFTDDYINSITTADELREAIENIKGMQGVVLFELGVFDKLCNLFYFDESEEGFDSDENIEEFLQYYQQLQPYLFKINAKFDQSSFLRTLQTADDFDAAALEIRNLEPQLKELVAGKAQTKAQQQVQCERRITYMENQLTKEQHAAQVKIDAFKDEVLHTTVKNKLKNLGPYADFLYNKIKVDLIANKDILLDDITMDDDIVEAMSVLVDEMLLDYENFRQPYVRVYETYKTLDAQIAAVLRHEGQLEGNPCLVEKLVVLERARQKLLNPNSFLPGVTVQELNEHNLEAQKTLRQVPYHDALVNLQTSLDEIRAYIVENPDEDESVNQAKNEELDSLEDILKDTDRPAKSRLKDISLRGMSNASQQILIMNSDHVLVNLVKAFFTTILSALGIWQSKEEQVLTSFNQHLQAQKNTGKDEDATADVDANEEESDQTVHGM